MKKTIADYDPFFERALNQPPVIDADAINKLETYRQGLDELYIHMDNRFHTKKWALFNESRQVVREIKRLEEVLADKFKLGLKIR